MLLIGLIICAGALYYSNLPKVKYVYPVRENIIFKDGTVSWDNYCRTVYDDGTTKNKYQFTYKIHGLDTTGYRHETTTCKDYQAN